VFDDGTGRPVDVDLRGSEEEVRTRAAAHEGSAGAADAGGEGDAPPRPKRGRGRPRLGVVGKEVTLLPRHWAWLDAQQGGASATLRRLIDRARKEAEGQEEVRAARDSAYRFMAALGGDLPGYEEALRALFRGDAETFSRETHDWPPDVRDHAALLATTAFGRPVAAEGDR
jgi:hypothetical protein